MLATGGSSIAAIQLLKDKGCKSIRLLCIIAAPEGVKAMQEAHPDVDIYIGQWIRSSMITDISFPDWEMLETVFSVPNKGDTNECQAQ